MPRVHTDERILERASSLLSTGQGHSACVDGFCLGHLSNREDGGKI